MSKANVLIFFSMMLLLFSCARSPEQKIDHWMKKYSGKETPGAALMLIKDGAPILIKTYGMANVEKKEPVKPETNFRLASFTKQFTAMSILMLVEQGKLTLNQNLQEIFPDFPDYGKKITVNHLLHHTSGLLDYESLIPDTATVQVLDRDVLQMMKAQDSSYFEPGTQFRYSNTGYAVLAMIVEKVSGERFADFLKNHIFDKIGMNSTVAYEKGRSAVPNRAYGYAEENGKLVPKDQSLTSAVLGDGGIYSNVLDLFKWDQALYTDTLVSYQTLNFAFTPDTLEDGTATNYGCGWRIDHFKGHPRMHHTGQTCGFTTIIQRYPEDKFTIIILTNRNKPMLNEIADKIAELYL